MYSMRLDYSRMLLFLAGFVTLISNRPAQPLSVPLPGRESCDRTIWDDTREEKGVRNVRVTCDEGHVSWRNPYGALRVALSPYTVAVDRTFQLCFRATAHFNVGKISVEQEGIQGGELRPLVLLTESQPSMAREYCLRRGHAPVILYLEAVPRGVNGLTIGQIELDYDMEYLSDEPLAAPEDMEECRPCTEKELLHAICTSDFVVAGSIRNVTQQPEFGETQLALQVDKIYRQKQTIFSTRTIPDFTAITASPVSKYSPQVGKTLSPGGHVVAPHRCGIHGGAGRFIFLGKIRLKRALLKCAPRLEAFHQMWTRASDSGLVQCQLD